ncbi:MAG: FmdB family transcriptional regulator [Elusimicrobia bacterium CG06_land_8_20_14_3_00_38_11]|nr:MAG: FmdB family transcriptional regulator [Elusimicrobia bacterium CG06_land_8_20_14_3_00_38_11]
MPMYTYICKDCGQSFELLVGINAGKEELKCEKCGSKNIQRTVATFNTGSGGSSSSSSSCPTCCGGACNLG